VGEHGNEQSKQPRLYKSFEDLRADLRKEQPDRYPDSTVAFGHCYWIPDKVTGFGRERTEREGKGLHPFIIVLNTYVKDGRVRPGHVTVIPGSTDKRTGRKYLQVAPAEVLTLGSDVRGLKEDTTFRLGIRKPVAKRLLTNRTYRYIGELCSERQDELRDLLEQGGKGR